MGWTAPGASPGDLLRMLEASSAARQWQYGVVMARPAPAVLAPAEPA